MPDDLTTPETVPNAIARAEGMLVSRESSGDDYSDLVDALTDLRHLAELQGVSFEDALATSLMHYDHERVNAEEEV